jgi:hypothetical protein
MFEMPQTPVEYVLCTDNGITEARKLRKQWEFDSEQRSSQVVMVLVEEPFFSELAEADKSSRGVVGWMRSKCRRENERNFWEKLRTKLW